MKALTIHQPWASLIAAGAKLYETRSWTTNYRGPIAIHAAAVNPYKFIMTMPELTVKIMWKMLRDTGQIPQHGDFRYLLRGAVIATAELAGCHKIEAASNGNIKASKRPFLDRKITKAKEFGASLLPNAMRYFLATGHQAAMPGNSTT